MQEPGDVLAGMLAGLGGEVAEPAEQLDAHAPSHAVRVGLDDLAQPRVQVLAGATVLERVDEALVVEAGGDEADVGLGHAHGLGQEGVRVADGMAHADHAIGGQRRPRPDAPRHHRHRVGVVEQQRAGGRALRDLVGHLDHDRDRAQPAEDAADADRVGDRLAHAERRGDLEVGDGGLVAAHLDLVDEVVGAVEGARRSAWAPTAYPAPNRSTSWFAARSAYASRSASMSCRAIVNVPWSSANEHRSARMLRVNSTLPAPMMVTFAMRGSVADRHQTHNFTHGKRGAICERAGSRVASL